MEATLAGLTQWLLAHPHWASSVVFLISLSESLVVVGLFVPGTLVMPFIGALVALGALGLWETLLWAILGAIVGDGISFWIGHHYREHLRTLWPFTRHPEWIGRAETFFYRHGGKSIVFGRFAGPVRPIIPAVAGMLGMNPRFFYAVNILSALLWAPAYMLPGMVLGASLSLAASVATRLVFLVVIILGLLWLTAWLVRRIYLMIEPKTHQGFHHFITLCRQHHWIWGISLESWSPRHPRLLAMLELLGLLALAGFTFFILLGWQLYREGPLALDNQIYYLMQKLRAPWGDNLMLFIGYLADWRTGLAVFTGGLLWLAWNHYWKGLLYWCSVLLTGTTTALILAVFLPAYPPMQQVVTDMSHHLSSHAPMTVNTIVYGFLAVLLAGNIRPTWRRFPYTVFGWWMAIVVFSQLYLAHHWFSDLVLATTLGLFWIGVLGFAYHRHHPTADVPMGGLLAVVLSLFIGGGIWQISQDDRSATPLNQPQRQTVPAVDWWQSQWQTLPAYRVDWEGYAATPLTLQYAGSLEHLQQQLKTQGWTRPKTVDARAALQWLAPNAQLADLPVLPNVHHGHHEQLILVRPTPDQANSQLVLRLWDSGFALDGKQPIWVGNVTRQYLKTSLGLLNLPATETEFAAPLHTLQTHLALLSGLQQKIVQRQPADGAAFDLWVGAERRASEF